jgi:hypothetical protein
LRGGGLEGGEACRGGRLLLAGGAVESFTQALGSWQLHHGCAARNHGGEHLGQVASDHIVLLLAENYDVTHVGESREFVHLRVRQAYEIYREHPRRELPYRVHAWHFRGYRPVGVDDGGDLSGRISEPRLGTPFKTSLKLLQAIEQGSIENFCSDGLHHSTYTGTPLPWLICTKVTCPHVLRHVRVEGLAVLVEEPDELDAKDVLGGYMVTTRSDPTASYNSPPGCNAPLDGDTAYAALSNFAQDNIGPGDTVRVNGRRFTSVQQSLQHLNVLLHPRPLKRNPIRPRR